MESPASLGAVVRDRRLALGYSLGQLATKVNKTAASIRAWEKGDAIPTRQEVNALAAALDLDAAMLDGLVPDSHVWEEEPVADVEVNDPWAGSRGSAVEEAEGKTDDSSTAESDETSSDAAEEVTVDTAVAVTAEAATSVDEDDAAASDEDTSEEIDDADGADPSELDDDGVIDDIVDGHEALETAKAMLADDAIERPAPPDPAIYEAMTEAVPVVPAAVAVATPESSLETELRAATADPFHAARESNPLIYWWDTAVGWYRKVFDPSRRWIYRVRFVLLLIAFYIMLRVLGWAGSELWDAIGEVLDSISFSPSETPDVTN